ncbi:hypothetical protein H4582DRAFT_2065548 [Lactarius indigo]|nr:hypothetical protein H4582DRAFT_2065548 [Lactarius indigo]
MFKQKMYFLRDQLNGPTVTREISITCDAWQADNMDTHFAVTGHWIEEHAPGKWTLEHPLLRCLTHIINLETQAMISACSKSKYYNGNPADDHLPEDLETAKCDEIGTIHAICINVTLHRH